jgi:hypothetical protein
MTSPLPNPSPAYDSEVVYGNKTLYSRLNTLIENYKSGSDTESLVEVENFEIPIRSGKAWVVKKGTFPLLKSLASPSCSNSVPHFHLHFSFSINIFSSPQLTSFPGQILTLTTPHGPQVGDLNIFSLANPRERFWASRTRQLHASHVSIGDRLWSNIPYLRPLCTIIGDSLKGHGVDHNGGRVHDLLGTRCDPYGKTPFLAYSNLKHV